MVWPTDRPLGGTVVIYAECFRLTAQESNNKAIAKTDVVGCLFF